MIKNIFVPEKVGSHYILPKRVIGFDVGKTHVKATQLLYKGATVTIEKSIDVPLETSSASYEERAGKAIAKALEQTDGYDAIYTSITSSLVIFKELKLPFLAHQKISLVVDFEVEPLLPFSINDAVIDFIITKQDVKEKSSDILVAAVQKQHIAQHLSLFAAANAQPDVVTIDFFALYGLYKLIPAYASLPGGVALIDLGPYTTTIAFIDDGRLRLIRALPKGLVTIAKSASQALHAQNHEALEQIIRFGPGIDNPQEYVQAVKPAFTAFWQEINFTLSSFNAQVEHRQGINQLLLLGDGAVVKDIVPYATQQLGIPCDLFAIQKITQQETMAITSKGNIPPTNSISLSTALQTPLTDEFNLRSKEFALGQGQRLLIYQLIASAILFLMLIITLSVHTFWQLSSLKSAVTQSEQQVISTLRQQFKIPADEDNLESVITRAKNEIKKEEKLWFSFANPSRTPFLAYLLELTNRINKDDLGFIIDRLHLTESTLVITAHVKDYPAVSRLIDALKEPKSKLFRTIEKPQTPDFTLKIQLS